MTQEEKIIVKSRKNQEWRYIDWLKNVGQRQSVSPQPIFFDATKRRWRYFRLALVALLSAMGLVGFLSVRSILKHPLMITPGSGDLTMSQAVSEQTSAGLDKTQNNVSQDNIFTQFFKRMFSSGTQAQIDQSRRLAFMVTWDDTSYASLQANIDKIDQLIPEWFYLGTAQGDIGVWDTARQKKTLEYIAQKKSSLLITPLFNNYNAQTKMWDGQAAEQMLSDEVSRTETIANLLQRVSANNLDGIHIDLRNISAQKQPELILFMSQLADKFHAAGLQVSQSFPLTQDTKLIVSLSKFNDFLVLTAYDQDGVVALAGGNLADQTWFEKNLAEKLKQLSADKVVVGLGNFGYHLAQDEDPYQITFQEAMDLASAHSASISFEPPSLNPSFSYMQEEQRHRVVFLDATVTFNQIAFAKKYKPLGYALWRLGSEDPALWKIFDNSASDAQELANSLGQIPLGYDVKYEGRGEILKVKAAPKAGSRQIQYDPFGGYITGQQPQVYPTSYVITTWGADAGKKIVLTFDDGPDPEYTPQILDILKQYQIKATFFVIGINAVKHPQLVNRILSEGHEIGVHTFWHPNIDEISTERFFLELTASQRALEAITGRSAVLFRSPYGEDIEPETPAEMAPVNLTTKLGYYTVGMHIDPRDWDGKDAWQIARETIRGALANRGNIVVLHDGGGDHSATVGALPIIITTLKDSGFQFVSAADLLNVSSNQVMPLLTGSDKVTALSNWASVKMSSYFLSVLTFIFLAGIIFGFVRVIMIATLALWQKIYYRSKKTKSSDGFGELVSIIIPAYNEERVIKKTVDSILKSTYQNYEIIVVDDGSADGTLQVLNTNYFGNHRVRLFSILNGGKSSALNFGIKQARAEFIITLDADAIFKPNTVEKLVRHFVDPKVGAVAGNAKVGNRLNVLTRCQALEYISSQNMDRRALDALNGISVVPGVVGAWRRHNVLAAGGFSGQTLAEDCDLTLSIVEQGSRVVYEEEAISLTEAPDNFKSFIKQRFRWMFGTLQSAWKHRHIFFRPKYRALGLFTLPNLVVFQIIFPFVAPIMDLVWIFSIGWAFWQSWHHPLEFQLAESLWRVSSFYLIFLLSDLLVALTAFMMEKAEDKKLIWLTALQRFFYRQLFYYVALKTIFSAIRGRLVGWNKFERKGTVLDSVQMVTSNVTRS